MVVKLKMLGVDMDWFFSEGKSNLKIKEPSPEYVYKKDYEELYEEHKRLLEKIGSLLLIIIFLEILTKNQSLQ